jgi:hypothetical protein
MSSLDDNTLLTAAPAVLNVGIDAFNHSVTQHGGRLAQLAWRPPGDGDAGLAWHLARALGDARIDAANAEATERIIAARPLWEDVALRADTVWPEMRGTRLLLHAGAPVAWGHMCGPMKGAMVGAVLYEGWAHTPEQAERLLAGGEVEFAQCHDFGAVGPMTGIISASMPLVQVREATRGGRAYTNLNEGIGRCLRFGANGPDVLQRLKWFEAVLAPVLQAAVRQAADSGPGGAGGIDLKAIQAQALLMGDEVHSRNAASTALLFMQLAVALAAPKVRSALPAEHIHATLDFVARTSQFFLNFSMVSCKAIMDAAHGVPFSTVVTATARNGTETALRVSGLGRQWFTAPSELPQGLYFAGYSRSDACPDLGDSAITESAGFGGCSFAASPALTLLAGGSVADALRYSREMHEVTVTRNPGLSLPALDFAGAPCGIDLRKVLDTGIRPLLTTGIAHREAGIGQIGAGIVRVPMACYVRAFEAAVAQFPIR